MDEITISWDKNKSGITIFTILLPSVLSIVLMKHSKIVEEQEQNICAYVVFTNEDGTVMSVDMFKDYAEAADFFDRQVKEEFEGIRRDFPKARIIQESINPDDATLSWEVSILQMLKQRQFGGLKPFLKALFNRRKYCRHFCHAELGDAVI